MPRRSVPSQLTPFREYRNQPDFGCSVPDDRDAWLIAPCGQNRDSDSLTRSNFAVQLAELERIESELQVEGEEYVDVYELHRFGHWACGWVEIIIVRPDSPAAVYCAELADSLADYPVADEEHLSQLECDEAAESWDNYGADDMKRAIRAKFREVAPSVVEFLADNATNEQLREFMEELYPNEPYHFDGGGCNFPISRAVDNLGRDELAAFVRKVRA